jgi:hypothetical protein
MVIVSPGFRIVIINWGKMCVLISTLVAALYVGVTTPSCVYVVPSTVAVR